MLSFRDLYTANQVKSLAFFGTDTQGICETSYEVHRVDDARNLCVEQAYLVRCKIRVRVAGTGVGHLNPNSGEGFKNYPLMLRIGCSLDNQDQETCQLLRYSPKTVNTGIQLSSGENTSSSNSFTQQHSVGSSLSSTNGYNVEASVGAMGDMPTGSIGGGFNHSKTKESSVNDFSSSESSRSSVTSSDASMSIKDWGGYASPGAHACTIDWVFGQEYPWNAVRDRFTRGKLEDGKVDILLPQHIMNRLFDTGGSDSALSKSEPHPIGYAPIPYPPSELSLFGIDFKAEVEWLIPASQSMNVSRFTHVIEYSRGSHYTSGPYTSVQMDAQPSAISVNSPALDLVLLALDPITFSASEATAVIGFFRTRFLVPPSRGVTSRIVAAGNNLYATGTGFDTPMKATVTTDNPAVLTLQFKIIDPYVAPLLNMKHWKSSDTGCCLELVFNGDENSKTSIYVDSREGEGGVDNMTSIQLRNNNVDSLDYHDFLKLGLNKVDIRISPIGDHSQATYEVRALSIT